MKRNRRLLLRGLPVLLAGTLALSGSACAAPFGGGRGAAVEKFRQLQSDLNLSDVQKKQVREVLLSHREELRAQHAGTAAAREQLREATEAHGAAAGETSRAADELARQTKARALLTARIFEEIRPLLTPDQVRKLKAARESFQARGD